MLAIVHSIQVLRALSVVICLASLHQYNPTENCLYNLLSLVPYRSDLVGGTKFHNNLPDIPFDPKFLIYPIDPMRLVYMIVDADICELRVWYILVVSFTLLIFLLNSKYY